MQTHRDSYTEALTEAKKARANLTKYLEVAPPALFEVTKELVRVLHMPKVSVGEALDAYKAYNKVMEEVLQNPKPLPMILHCPECGQQHIDGGVWAERPHRTHQCQNCGFEWRPASIYTVGVEEI